MVHRCLSAVKWEFAPTRMFGIVYGWVEGGKLAERIGADARSLAERCAARWLEFWCGGTGDSLPSLRTVAALQGGW
ncbi:MAG TPA: hypothetical protein VGI16_04935 [Candidatus Acidoferrum sp.]